MSSRKRRNDKPLYFGEIQPWARFMKGIFSIISISVFLLALFGENHDVRGFFRSLLLASSPVLIDLLVVYCSIYDDKNFEVKMQNKIKYGLIAAAICFSVSMISFLITGHNITVIENYLNGAYWQLNVIFFPLILYAFYIDTFRPLYKKKNVGLRTEKR